MLVRLLAGRNVGTIVDLVVPAARAMLADGRAELPGTDIAPEVQPQEPLKASIADHLQRKKRG